MRAWILTGSLENFRVNVERGFDLIGLKERRRRMASELAPGDESSSTSPGVQAFGAIARVRSAMFEDRTPIWPQGGKRRPEAYPWRVDAEPVVVLEEADFVRAEEMAGDLEHVRKWPPDHWHLAFQGQLRPIGEADAALLRQPYRRGRKGRRLDPRAPLHRRGGQRAARRIQAAAARASRRQRPAHRRRGPCPARRGRVPRTAAASRAARSARPSSRSAACCGASGIRNRGPRHRPRADRLPCDPRRRGGLPLLGARRGRSRGGTSSTPGSAVVSR